MAFQGSGASGWCLVRDHGNCKYAACKCTCGHPKGGADIKREEEDVD